MQRDEFECVSCRCKDKHLNVHHKTYRKGADPWDYDDENFITYCIDCHGVIHEEKDFLMTYIDTAEKMRRLATMSYFCDAKHIRLAQIVCTLAALERSGTLNQVDIDITIEKAEEMIQECKNLLKIAKRKNKSK